MNQCVSAVTGNMNAVSGGQFVSASSSSEEREQSEAELKLFLLDSDVS